jgi:phospholipid/cholesterol/gamma-HCH transport system ATP-binding protein
VTPSEAPSEMGVRLSEVRMEHVGKQYGPVWAVKDVSISIRPGEFYTLLGPSGCGKTTVLRMLAGFVAPDTGRIVVDDEPIDPVPPWKRNFGMVFQQCALWPHMSVFENVAFPLREKSRRSDAEIRGRVEEKLEQVGLGGMGPKNPAEISGGMRKRVAIARALVTEPEIVFFDEPTTGLDPILVNTIHHLIVDLHRKFRFTAVMVSHEIPEIFEIADRVAMLHDGRIVEIGPPAAIQASTTPVVRQFIRGEPEGGT